MSPLLTRVRVLAAKVEATPGTAESLAADDAAFNVFDAQMQPQMELAERPQQGGFSRLPSVPGARLGVCRFSLDLYSGGGAQPAWAEVFLLACGFKWNTTKYVLDAVPVGAAGSGQKTITIGLYENGVVKKIHGAMGNAKFICPSGKVARVEFEFTGIWNAPADIAILSPTYPAYAPLRFYSSALTIGSWNPAVSELALDLGNQVVMREDSTKASGYAYANITNRLPVVTIDPEAGLVATHDLYGKFLAGTEGAFSFSLNNADGDAAAFAATEAQFRQPQEADRNGLQTDQVEVQINADDLEITFS